MERVIHQRTLHVGPEEVVVAAKVAVAPGARAEDIAESIDVAEARAREAVPGLTLLIYVEPDIELAPPCAGGPFRLTSRGPGAG